MPADKSYSKTSDYRRATKPLMEKRRRARINQCLNELKTLVLDALHEDPSRHSKLEKADILDMSVRYLQNIQRQQVAAAIATDPAVFNKFKAGFNECAAEVRRYVSQIEIDYNLRQRLLSHLGNTIARLATPTTGMTFSFPEINCSLSDIVHHLQRLGVQIPIGILDTSYGNLVPPRTVQNIPPEKVIDNSNNEPKASSSILKSSSTLTNIEKILEGLPLIPSRLTNGDIACLLPSRALSSVHNQFLNSLILDSRATNPSSFVVNTSNSTTSSYFLSPWGSGISSEVPRRSTSVSSSLDCSISPSAGDSYSDVLTETLMAPPKESSRASNHSPKDLSLSAEVRNGVQRSSLTPSNTSVSFATKIRGQSLINKQQYSDSSKIGNFVNNNNNSVVDRSTINHMESFQAHTSLQSLRKLTSGHTGSSSGYTSFKSDSSITHKTKNQDFISVLYQPTDEAVWRPW